MFGALAQYERSLTRERVIAGLRAAERRGRRGGRPLVLTPEKIEAAQELLNGGVRCRLLPGRPACHVVRSIINAYWSMVPISEGPVGLFLPMPIETLYHAKIYAKKTCYDFWNITVEKCNFASVAPILRDLAGIGSAPQYQKAMNDFPVK